MSFDVGRGAPRAPPLRLIRKPLFPPSGSLSYPSLTQAIDTAPRYAIMTTSASLEAWRNRLPDDDFSFGEISSHLVVLQTGTFTLDHNVLWPVEKQMMVYAEHIDIAESVTLPGRTLWLFCNKLTLGSSMVVVDVSGKSGTNGAPNATPKLEINGQNGGSVYLYVETLEENLVPITTLNPATGKPEYAGLYIYANGGDGGTGSTNTDASKNSGRGNNGGDPGKPGRIAVYFSDQTCNALVELANMMDGLVRITGDADWKTKIQALIDYKYSQDVQKQPVDQLKQALQAYITWHESFDSLNRELAGTPVGSAPGDLSASAIEARASIQEVLDRIMSSKCLPDITTTFSDDFTNFRRVVTNVRTNSDPSKAMELWTAYQTTADIMLKTLQSVHANKTGVLSQTLKTAFDAIQAEYENVTMNTAVTMSSAYQAEPGTSGTGGTGYGPGMVGQPGQKYTESGQHNATFLVRSGARYNLNTTIPIANAEQCQMLLNLADLQYFQATATGVFDKAKDMYTHLSRRLSFVPRLLERGNNESKLFAAYDDLHSLRIAFKPLVQLEGIKRRADLCLNRIQGKQDMLGYPPEWAPRRSFQFYLAGVERHIESIEALEKLLPAFSTSSQTAQATLERVKSDTDSHLKVLGSRITDLNGERGELNSSARVIAAYSPAIKKKRVLLGNLIKSAEKDIQNYTKVDPKAVIEALTMVVFCPNAAMAGVQAFGLFEKTSSSFQALDGSTVERKYVVNQFQKMDNKFESLTEGYKSRSDSTIDVDDPGADKILAAKDDIEDLIRKYKDAIRTGNAKAIHKEIDGYVDLIKRRNDAVFTYNAAVQVLGELKSEEAVYQKQQAAYGAEFIQIDKNLPVGRYYATKLINDARLSILMELTKGAKAIRYWALTTPESIKYDGYQKFPASAAIKAYRDGLIEAFDNCLKSYGSLIYNQFPKLTDREERGTNALGYCYKLNQTIVDTLKSSGKPDDIAASENRPASAGEGTDDTTGPGATDEPAPQPVDPNSKRLYEVFFEIPLVTKATTASEHSLAGYWDLRIDQIRVWLFGATVDSSSPKLRIKLEHLGTERIVKYEDGSIVSDPSTESQATNPALAVSERIFTFKHDHVAVNFEYNPLGILNIEDTSKAKIPSGQNFPGVYRGQNVDVRTETLAPMGPFGQWKLSVDASYHIHLDLSNLTGITIELWGSTAQF
ncbi:uncharacterized protein K460DRAFT_400616 [Cucurbitaria berberidis CBS 394.84]|uniref:Uncharacterized protein n=1 Tax=Cucurbitaria berberidis CBS 394.84 TaxID=1168544 RepID=A0A9P4GS72_9PLEO|nr:uncharacterized protein K460DRAFT_400616 [Cucurbitaria berberidis CBS 394.84]KAF1850559.1 hypothetical protein K460DRAFT_400616 [Cucurbitaria berberidis CBS 394.84]